MPRISSAAHREARDWPPIYLGVALTALATLVLELTLTRIFSAVFYYHFAFLAISIALFGLGAGGVLSSVFAPKDGDVFRRLGVLACAASVSCVVSLSIVLTRTSLTNLTLAGIYFAGALPFVFAGAVVSLAISETPERVHRVYLFYLLGAASGCVVLVPLLNIFGGPNTVLVASVLLSVSAAIWFHLASHIRARAAAVALALAFVGLITLNWKMPLLDVTSAKGQPFRKEKFVKWNSLSRVAVAPDAQGKDSIYIDAGAFSTAIANFDFANLSEEDRRRLLLQGPGLPYQLRPGAKTLIIGPGGGWDVSRAIAAGSSDVTGVEINPLIAGTIMRERFPELSFRLYFRPGVRIEVEDARSFIRRSAERYQVIQTTHMDNGPPGGAEAASALSENNLYTTDAFVGFLTHLQEDGILAFTRWSSDPPRESLRLLSLARVALGRLGQKDYPSHAIVVRDLTGGRSRDTVLISRTPFQEPDLQRARKVTAEAGMAIVYLPGAESDSPIAQLLRTGDPEQFFENYRYDVSPVSDDRPFFFYTVQPRDILGFFVNEGKRADDGFNGAVPLLLGVLAISVLATAMALLLPPLLLGSRLPQEPGVRGLLLYFLFVGAGYILTQVALIQEFAILLGHLTYSLAVIVFSMLLSSGIGSYFSLRMIGADGERLRRTLLGISILIAVTAGLAPMVSNQAIAWPFPGKVLATGLVIAPAAFLMGMPFPVGLSMLELRDKPSVRWAWAINASASVLGSASAIFIALHAGIRATMLTGAMLYLAASIVVHLTNKTAKLLTVSSTR